MTTVGPTLGSLNNGRTRIVTGTSFFQSISVAAGNLTVNTLSGFSIPTSAPYDSFLTEPVIAAQSGYQNPKVHALWGILTVALVTDTDPALLGPAPVWSRFSRPLIRAIAHSVDVYVLPTGGNPADDTQEAIPLALLLDGPVYLDRPVTFEDGAGGTIDIGNPRNSARGILVSDTVNLYANMILGALVGPS